MKLTPITSSNISAAAWADDSLFVQFVRTGDIYEYPGVSEDTFIKFLRAESQGKFFAAEIKARHEGRKLSDEEKSAFFTEAVNT